MGMLFNRKFYLFAYKDVALAVTKNQITAEEHFMDFGRFEGRSFSSSFDSAYYMRNNKDVGDAVSKGKTTAYDHLITYGLKEDRPISTLFIKKFYLDRNPDVKAAVDAGKTSAFEHFESFGKWELRSPSVAIDLQAYVNANPDVAAAVAAVTTDAVTHLMTYGVKEGRDLGNGVKLSDFSADSKFTTALSAGNIAEALDRVKEVAPFLPTFVKPSTWTPPADLNIPTDFTPISGVKLIVPASVTVPAGTTLPDTFVTTTTTTTTTGGGGSGGGGSVTPTFPLTSAVSTENITALFAATAEGANGTAVVTGMTDAQITALVGAKMSATGITGAVTDMNAAALTALAGKGANIGDGTLTGTLALTSAVTAENITALFTEMAEGANGTAVVTSMDAAQLIAVGDGSTKIAIGGVTGIFSMNGTDFTNTQITALLGATTNDAAVVTVDATAMNADALTATGVGIGKVDTLTISASHGVSATAANITGKTLAISGGVAATDFLTVTGTAGSDTTDLSNITTTNASVVYAGGAGADMVTFRTESSSILRQNDIGQSGGFILDGNSHSTVNFDIIRGFNSGDKLHLSTYIGNLGSANGFSGFATSHDMTHASAGNNIASYIRGVYSGIDNLFSGDASGNDSLLIYDADVTDGIAHEAIVIVGAGTLTAGPQHAGWIVFSALET